MLPEEQPETNGDVELSEEDAAERDRRNEAIRKAAAAAEFSRQTQVLQRALPRPSSIDIDALIKSAAEISDPSVAAIARETALLIANDALKYPPPGAKLQGTSKPLQTFDDSALSKARGEIAKEMDGLDLSPLHASFSDAWTELHSSSLDDDDPETLSALQDSLQTSAERSNKLEKKLSLHYGGYQSRAKTLRSKIEEASEALTKEKVSLDTFRTLQVAEEAALPRRLEALREEVEVVSKREKELQEVFRRARAEVEELRGR